jgi:hypothetical protein
LDMSYQLFPEHHGAFTVSKSMFFALLSLFDVDLVP